MNKKLIFCGQFIFYNTKAEPSLKALKYESVKEMSEEENHKFLRDHIYLSTC